MHPLAYVLLLFCCAYICYWYAKNESEEIDGEADYLGLLPDDLSAENEFKKSQLDKTQQEKNKKAAGLFGQLLVMEYSNPEYVTDEISADDQTNVENDDADQHVYIQKSVTKTRAYIKRGDQIQHTPDHDQKSYRKKTKDVVPYQKKPESDTNPYRKTDNVDRAAYRKRRG